jgi:hypothetical protein
LHLLLEYIHATHIKQKEITTKAKNMPNYVQIIIKLIIKRYSLRGIHEPENFKNTGQGRTDFSHGDSTVESQKCA